MISSASFVKGLVMRLFWSAGLKRQVIALAARPADNAFGDSEK